MSMVDPDLILHLGQNLQLLPIHTITLHRPQMMQDITVVARMAPVMKIIVVNEWRILKQIKIMMLYFVKEDKMEEGHLAKEE